MKITKMKKEKKNKILKSKSAPKGQQKKSDAATWDMSRHARRTGGDKVVHDGSEPQYTSVILSYLWFFNWRIRFDGNSIEWPLKNSIWWNWKFILVIFECDVISWKIFLICFGLMLCESLNSCHSHVIRLKLIESTKESFPFQQRNRSNTIL